MKRFSTLWGVSSLSCLSRIDHTNNVNTANTVAASNGIGSQKQIHRVSGGLLLAILSILELDGNAFLEVNSEVLGLVRGSQGVLGQLPHVGWRSSVGIFQNAGLVGAVGEVLIHRPGLGLRRSNRDALLGSVSEEIVAAGETFVKDGVTPWGNDLNVGLQSVECKLEADLVVTLTGATVGNSEAALALIDDAGVKKRYQLIGLEVPASMDLPGQQQSEHGR